MAGPARAIVVLNPNSSESVTAALDRTLEPLRLAGGPAIECATLSGTPPAIESDADVASVVAPTCAFVRARAADAAAFVIACFSDPGLAEARRVTRAPVFGMAECGLLTALARGDRFGVVSILAESLPRHMAAYRRLGIEHRLAADLPVGLGVLELADHGRALTAMREVGTRLRDEHGADVIVLGCAGMAALRDEIEASVGIPVVEPVVAAVAMALGAVQQIR
ncbi:MAG: aspartate/glutamate racemase family protein [Gammaproteobacteria bacterium]|nr:aspartate/glutamate racemase family protein [Gammaproteobacteria bacterium]